ncbi:hypothetical protein [Desulfoplanes sp.]
MAGLVRWLHYIGIKTSYSCDGHGERPSLVEVITGVGIALWILRTRSRFFQKRRGISITYQQPLRGRNVSPPRTANRYHLLKVAEWLYEKRDELKDLVGKMRSISDRGRPGRYMR